MEKTIGGIVRERMTLAEVYQAQKLLTGQRCLPSELQGIQSSVDLEASYRVQKEEFIDFILLALHKAMKLEK